jgi:hypothetical protein
MKYHSANDCLRVATAIKAQVDYLLFAIGNKDDKQCEHHLEQIRELSMKLKREMHDD